MPAKAKTKKTPTASKPDTNDFNILITGDMIIDHNLYLGKRYAPGSKNLKGTKILKSFGGAGLLYKIADKVMKTKALNSKKKKTKSEKDVKEIPAKYKVQFGFDIKDLKNSNTIDQINLEKSHHSYSVWTPCSPKNDSNNSVWRMTQPFGYGDLCDHSNLYKLTKSAEDKKGYKVVVLDDGALGFRNSNNKTAWPDFITEKTKNLPEWVIYKMSSPVAQGDLFRKLSSKYQDRLIIMVSINDLRREEVGITKGLSWERTAVDLLSSLKFNARINKLTKCKHLIINFGTEGALWINTEDNSSENKLVFDPSHMEREWDQAVEGSAFGFMSCLTASIINQLTMPKEGINIGKGIMSGLSAMRCLNISGHGDINSSDDPGFPFNEIAQKLLAPSEDYSIVDIPPLPDTNTDSLKHWTIMEGAHGVSSDPPNPFYGLGRRVALFGPKSLSGIPYSRFGKLFTVDRKEVESLRGIERLISQYEAKKRQKKPLSIAVFGPPGSGKSFGIKQIAKSIMDLSDDDILEFNLSQFANPKELTAAFHQVRDMVLKGKTPCVFWDEFDSKQYSWLQYLLAPMQDGEFREGQLVHPIGKCVFVFAGGTSFDMENFGPTKKNTKESIDEYKRFKFLKGPDFVSRLNGYLNVLGPNKRQIFDKKSEQWQPDDNPKDICFPVRRALLLRVMLGYFKNEELDIDSGLLTALLEIDEYKHGARSLETILTLSKQEGSNALRRSDLPPREQISLHVDFDKFLALVNRDLTFKMNREVIAPYVHEYYRELGRAGKWLKSEMDKKYNDLEEFIKESNLAAAERVPEVLSLVGLQIQSEKEKPVPKNKSKRLTKNDYDNITKDKGKIELMAEAEHNGWMEFLFLNGWTYDERRNDEEKKHNLLIPYHDLSEENMEKDRNSVKSYFPILENAGYNIIQSK